MNTVSTFDVVLVNGKILDGCGNPWFYADVGIRDGKIVALGDLSDATGLQEIDAEGLVVAPGFIDAHTHVDTGVFEVPQAGNAPHHCDA